MIKELKQFIILWSTQSLSQLGSSMTSFALTLWLYEKTGSALETAMLSICSYAPYVIMSIFAGALSDRWNKKKTMLVCDTFAAFCTIIIFIMLRKNILMPWHLYALNMINGLMNTVQQPASDVAMTLLIPKKYYQKTSAMKSLSQSLITILNPIMATAIFSILGIYSIIAIDLFTFSIAFISLILFIKIPDIHDINANEETILFSAKNGLKFLKENPMILTLILFLSGVNFVASAFDATLPAYVLSNPNGGEIVLGIISSSAGIATLAGSIIAVFLPRPKNRIKVIYLTMLFSLSVENFILAFTDIPILWCFAQFIGWCVVPIMNTNLDVILRSSIPVEMQGRVYSCRNTLQFFTIPLGLFFGGVMVDKVCTPLLEKSSYKILKMIFGASKGAGAAMVMFILGILGTMVCLTFGSILKKYSFNDTET